jgi:hypothetical protein
LSCFDAGPEKYKKISIKFSTFGCKNGAKTENKNENVYAPAYDEGNYSRKVCSERGIITKKYPLSRLSSKFPGDRLQYAPKIQKFQFSVAHFRVKSNK